MSQNNERKRKKKAIETAKELIKGVDARAQEERGRVTKSLLRKMLELAINTALYSEFKLRLLYLANRNSSNRIHELERFVQQLTDKAEEIPAEEQRMSFLRLVLEYANMARAAKEMGISI